MSDSIKISPKHGLNTTIPLCFFCGEEKSEVALLGKMKGDVEAPRNLILDYEPCDKCKALMQKGITVIAMSDRPIANGQPPLQDNAYPTGAWCVISENGLRKMCDEETFIDTVIRKRIMLMDHRTFDEMFADNKTTADANKKEDGDVQ